MLTREEIARVQASFDALWPRLGRAVDRFYDLLFERAPDVKPMFRHDLDQQKLKFTEMLTTAVGAVENRSLFLSVVHDLGRRHAAYGVTLSHFDLVRGAVLDSLAETLGPRFDAATRAAWAALLDDLRAVMLGGMATPA